MSALSGLAFDPPTEGWWINVLAKGLKFKGRKGPFQGIPPPQKGLKTKSPGLSTRAYNRTCWNYHQVELEPLKEMLLLVDELIATFE